MEKERKLEDVIYICDCGGNSWIIGDKEIFCNKCGRRYRLPSWDLTSRIFNENRGFLFIEKNIKEISDEEKNAEK